MNLEIFDVVTKMPRNRPPVCSPDQVALRRSHMVVDDTRSTGLSTGACPDDGMSGRRSFPGKLLGASPACLDHCGH